MRIVLKKRPDYWKEGRGWLDGADVTVINDGSARLNALISGQVDAINRVDHKAVGLLSKAPKIEVVRALRRLAHRAWRWRSTRIRTPTRISAWRSNTRPTASRS